MADHNHRGENEHGAQAELPVMQGPPLSPADWLDMQTGNYEAEPEAATDAGFRLVRRPPGRVTLIAALALVAGLGALCGAAVSYHFSDHGNAKNIEERKAMQKSIAQLNDQVDALKAKLATATAAARDPIAKITQQLDADPTVTGSVANSKTTSVPIPRPAPAIAAAASQPAIVEAWHISSELRGAVYVVNHGRAYRAKPGAMLPGLGAVQAVERRDDRWVVVTPKGIIVALRDRNHFGGS